MARESLKLTWSAAVVAIVTAVCIPTTSRAQNAKTAQSSPPPFSLTIRAEQPTVKAGSPVWVHATMENKSDADLSVFRANAEDQGGWVYDVNARDEKGGKPPETHFYRRRQGHLTPEEVDREPINIFPGGGPTYPLKPGKTIEDRVNVSKLYDLSHPAKYTIQFRRLDPGSKSFVKSNEITVTVTP